MSSLAVELISRIANHLEQLPNPNWPSLIESPTKRARGFWLDLGHSIRLCLKGMQPTDCANKIHIWGATHLIEEACTGDAFIRAP